MLHSRFQKTGGVNVWGYRGPIVGRKRAGEHRIVMLGGSSAFGYGVSTEEAIPAQLQSMLDRSGSAPFSVVNLGYNNEGAYSLRFTLADYLYLDYDLAILYEGYNDLIGSSEPNFSVFRHESPIFRRTGYLPILPVVFREKAAALLYRRTDHVVVRRAPQRKESGLRRDAQRARRGRRAAIDGSDRRSDRTSSRADIARRGRGDPFG